MVDLQNFYRNTNGLTTSKFLFTTGLNEAVCRKVAGFTFEIFDH